MYLNKQTVNTNFHSVPTQNYLESPRVWRLKLNAQNSESQAHLVHSCYPDLSFQQGAILYASQITEPMMSFIGELNSVEAQSSAIRAALQNKFGHFVDPGVVQTVLEKLAPTHGIELQPEIRELIDFLEANENEFEHQCQYLPTKLRPGC